MSEASSVSENQDKSNENKPSSSEESSSSPRTMTMESLRKYFSEKLGLNDDDDESEQLEKVKVLDDVSVDGVIDYIKKKECTRIITMAGAGISTSAGIPDFRTPGTGLYHNLQKYQLPHPQAIFELDFFAENPRPFFELAKELYPGSFKPTVCHYFIKMLVDKGLLLRHYTQNIDTLERVAGIPEDKIVEAHGTFHTGHCMGCKREYTQEWMRDKIFNDDIPICEICPGVVKPDIVFFGENLPSRFHKLMNKDFEKCEVLIILGSSLAVQPFASLVDRVPDNIPRLLINREKAGHRTGLMALLGMGGGLDFDSKENTRDVLWLGDCDEGCQLLAEKLGFGDELKELIKREHERIDNDAKQDESVPSKSSSKEDTKTSPKL